MPAPVITVERAGEHDGQEVALEGLALRVSAKPASYSFPIFRDGTGVIQGVVSLKESPEAFAALKGTHPGIEPSSSRGKIRPEPRAPGGFEIGVSKVEVIQRVPESMPYPIQLEEHGVDFLLDRRHLWIRTPRQAAILRIRADAVPRRPRHSWIARATSSPTPPIFTPAACEGTSTLFEVQYIDDEKAYLTQSGQLYGEAMAAALGKFTFSAPPSAAEKSKTRRYPTEFPGCSSPKPTLRTLKT